ncbi:MAG: hypothetical protein ACOYM2_10420 [Rectinemataceae bacterium]
MNAVRIIADVESDTITVPNMGQFKGKRVELIILPFDEDREEMIHASLVGLARGYGDDEPEDTEQDVRERNPNHEKRRHCPGCAAASGPGLEASTILLLRELPGFGDWLTMGISTQLRNELKGWDVLVDPGKPEYSS